MSAIAGIIHFDGAPVLRADLERISQALEPYGRDTENLITGPGFGFVSRIAYFTPEDRLERQPVNIGPHGKLVFDGRLDNRSALVRELGIASAEARLLADGSLTARAWERWGRACLPRLVGAFSLAHWDNSLRTLTFARSAPSGKPLFFHRQGSCLYFASALPGLFAHPKVPRQLSEPALGDLLLRNDLGNQSLFQDIEIIPNAHWVEHNLKGSERARFWTPDPEHRLRFRREEEAWEAFCPLFEEAVSNQLRSIHPPGVLMSGGLDSAAVAGQAALILGANGKNLRSYTRVPAADTPLRPDGLFYNNERPRVEQMVSMHPNLSPSFVDAGDEPILAGLEEVFANGYFITPRSPTNFSGYLKLIRHASNDGVRVLLTGAMGNASISYDGHARLRSLLVGGRWFALAQELGGLKRRRGHVRDIVKSELLDPLFPQGLRPSRLRPSRQGKSFWSHFSSLHGDFAHHSGAQERLATRGNIKLNWRCLDSWQRRAFFFLRPGYGGLENFHAPPEMDLREPTSDLRVVEFCLALPDEFYLKQGLDRRFARLGLARLIPEAIRMNPAIGRHDVEWPTRVAKEATAISRCMDELAADPVVSAMLDLPAMRETWARFEQIDWRHAPLSEVIRHKQGVLGALAVGLFVRWCNGENN